MIMFPYPTHTVILLIMKLSAKEVVVRRYAFTERCSLFLEAVLLRLGPGRPFFCVCVHTRAIMIVWTHVF